jgi:acetylornithine deacetylase/succinyl-diaminopimelate desuccinylase-like protein
LLPFEYVTKHAERFVQDWRDACKIPSISEREPAALARMAASVCERAQNVLDEAELVDCSAAAPTVMGVAEGKGSSTLLLYSHYDVQPVEPLDDWDVPPFDAVVRDGRLIARGACDDKADVMARLHALETWRATRGELPCTIVWLSEGAEESGSIGLDEVIASRRTLLASCDWCLWESYLRRDDGHPEIGFGCRGMLYVELSLRCLAQDQHSAFASIFRSAPTELARALVSLKDEMGIVAIDGFHDSVRAGELPAPSELGVAPPEGSFGVEGNTPFLVDEPAEMSRRLLFEPTANIAGLISGYTGSGAKTVLPAEARAKVDFRLVPDQDPLDVVQKLRRHLDTNGFEDVRIEVIHSVPPAASPLDSKLARVTVAAATELFGHPVRYPFVPGSGPVHHVASGLGIPTVMPPGATRMDSGIHAANESALVSDYLDTVRLTLRVLEHLASDGD